MISSDKAKPDDGDQPRDDQARQEVERDPAVIKQHPVDPELADIEELRKVEKRSS